MGIASMNATIKNNRNLLKDGKRKPFTTSLGGYQKNRSYKPYVMPEVQPHVIRRVRIKIRRQNRRLLIKQLVIGGFVALVLIYLIFL